MKSGWRVAALLAGLLLPGALLAHVHGGARAAPVSRPPAPVAHPGYVSSPRPPVNRPANIGGSTTNVARPANIGTRTTINNPTIAGKRTTIAGGSRSVNVNAPGAGSTVVAGRRPTVPYRPASYNRPWAGRYPWYHGGWHGWRAWPTYWGVGGAGPAAVYSNPYFVPVPVAVATGGPTVIQSSTYEVPRELDYSRPIPRTTGKDDDSDVVEAAQGCLDAGRTAFKKGDYKGALAQAERGIHLLPGDGNLHEFRALCLFALKKYKESAATLYAVLAAGPGWDWETLSTFYPDTDTYTKQLRALEGFVKDNPRNAAARFLLAYHYLVLDERGAALEQLKAVVKLQPKDELSKSLVESLEKDRKGRPAQGD